MLNDTRKPTGFTLRRFNNILSVLLILIVVYMLLSPVIGEALFYIRHHFEHNKGYVYQSKTLKTATNTQLKPIPVDNRLVIPSMGLDQPINEGKSVYTLNKGIWHMPNTADPTLPGNMVMLGHRFTYKGPAVLFFLDKVKTGDPIIIYWQHKEYDYTVTSTRAVSRYDLTVTMPTTNPTVTIYTCTPLWTDNQRLVVTANLGGS